MLMGRHRQQTTMCTVETVTDFVFLGSKITADGLPMQEMVLMLLTLLKAKPMYKKM